MSTLLMSVPPSSVRPSSFVAITARRVNIEAKCLLQHLTGTIRAVR